MQSFQIQRTTSRNCFETVSRKQAFCGHTNFVHYILANEKELL